MKITKNIIIAAVLIPFILIFASCGEKQDTDAGAFQNQDTSVPALSDSTQGEWSDANDTESATDTTDYPDSQESQTEVEPESQSEPVGEIVTNDCRTDDSRMEGFIFLHNDTAIYLGDNMDATLTKIGEWTDFYESPSCAFDGMAKIYVYNGFELATYVKNSEDYDHIYSVTFGDDSVSTTEGICIGMTFDDMVSAYGTEYEEIPGLYMYVKGGTVLSFNMDGDIIVSISYSIEDIYA